jgi:predicted AlkP superfamily pyrophosphatase or phosphodiesterase
LSGGTAAVILADPGDAAVRAEVAALLDRLARDPGNGIDRILGHEEIVREGGFPDAAFLVSFKNGYEVGSAFSGPVVSGPSNRGMHGYVPDRPELRSSFFIVGPHVAAGRSLGEIDMRRIAPTLARVLGLSLPDAELAPLALEQP